MEIFGQSYAMAITITTLQTSLPELFLYFYFGIVVSIDIF